MPEVVNSWSFSAGVRPHMVLWIPLPVPRHPSHRNLLPLHRVLPSSKAPSPICWPRYYGRCCIIHEPDGAPLGINADPVRIQTERGDLIMTPKGTQKHGKSPRQAGQILVRSVPGGKQTGRRMNNERMKGRDADGTTVGSWTFLIVKFPQTFVQTNHECVLRPSMPFSADQGCPTTLGEENECLCIPYRTKRLTRSQFTLQPSLPFFHLVATCVHACPRSERVNRTWHCHVAFLSCCVA